MNDDDDARATLRAARDSGFRYFDTAPVYGFGLSEHRIGAALGTLPRGEPVISTKVAVDPSLWFLRKWGGSVVEQHFDPTGNKLGTAVTVTPDDVGRDAVEGILVGADDRKTVVRRDDPRAGALQVHFPRAGYDLETA